MDLVGEFKFSSLNNEKQLTCEFQISIIALSIRVYINENGFAFMFMEGK